MPGPWSVPDNSKMLRLHSQLLGPTPIRSRKRRAWLRRGWKNSLNPLLLGEISLQVGSTARMSAARSERTPLIALLSRSTPPSQLSLPMSPTVMPMPPVTPRWKVRRHRFEPPPEKLNWRAAPLDRMTFAS